MIETGDTDHRRKLRPCSGRRIARHARRGPAGHPATPREADHNGRHDAACAGPEPHTLGRPIRPPTSAKTQWSIVLLGTSASLSFTQNGTFMGSTRAASRPPSAGPGARAICALNGPNHRAVISIFELISLGRPSEIVRSSQKLQ